MDLYKKDSYKNLVITNAYNTLEFLLKEGLDFMIVSYTNVIECNPPIPKDVIEFEESAIFIIANYTKESAILNKDNLSFEAGFGTQNFGSTITIPLEAIEQIVVEENILHISYYKPQKKIESKDSMELLLNNPENQKLIKRKLNKK